MNFLGMKLLSGTIPEKIPDLQLAKALASKGFLKLNKEPGLKQCCVFFHKCTTKRKLPLQNK